MGTAEFLRDDEVTVEAAGATVAGRLTVPGEPRGLVVFAHGSGSSRHSPRNRYVAQVLQNAGLATLLFDLLTDAEERNRSNVFDIGLLAARLVDMTLWLRSARDAAGLQVGYFAGPAPEPAPHCGRRLIPGRRLRGGVPRRPAGPGRRIPRSCERTHPVDRRKPRRRRPGPQPAGGGDDVRRMRGRGRRGAPPTYLRKPEHSRKSPSWRGNGFDHLTPIPLQP